MGAGRFWVPGPWTAEDVLDLPPQAARHAQVLRLQPGDPLDLFCGDGQLWSAVVTHMGRQRVQVQVRGRLTVPPTELPRPLHLACVMPANDRMDFLIEKATELGVSAVQPLMAERSVLRLSGARAEKKVQHWQAVAQAACEQSGRLFRPTIHPVRGLLDYAQAQADRARAGSCWVLSTDPAAPGWAQRVQAQAESLDTLHLLSGPEGGFSPQELAAVQAAGWWPVSLGPRILRADTAPLAALAAWGLSASNPPPDQTETDGIRSARSTGAPAAPL